MHEDIKAQLAHAIHEIVNSPAKKKLVLAGPGAGKTTLFKTLLEGASGKPSERLVLTFIKNLADDLEADLGSLASVRTLHGYCQSLLRTSAALRDDLPDDFTCLPGLATLIEGDWRAIRKSSPPRFVRDMQTLTSSSDLDFYLDRGNYYRAVDFDDSVFRVHKALTSDPTLVGPLELVLIDEFQDFNALEASIVRFLADKSPILLAGDDDQALYSALRAADCELIRALYNDPSYAHFNLPFCMRCPSVVVDSVGDVIARAHAHSYLPGRINKPFNYYPPVKGADSARYPTIQKVLATVQRPNANYLGRYVAEQISLIPKDEVDEAVATRIPLALIIGARRYTPAVVVALKDLTGYKLDTGHGKDPGITREAGLRILKDDFDSNLGWRIVLEFETAAVRRTAIRKTNNVDTPLVIVVSDRLREAIRTEVDSLEVEAAPTGPAVPASPDLPLIKVTSFEGAKGLSAQHVFIVGLHDSELPKNPTVVKDIEVCKFIVGLTRTRKQCSILCCQRFGADRKTPSTFLAWIKPERFSSVKVDAEYWKIKR